MKKILFICSANIQRSKTAEDYFAAQYPQNEYVSAGTNIKMCQREGTIPLDEDLLIWADLILVMENRHLQATKKIGKGNYGKKIKVLNIPDRYKYYQPELLDLLEEKVRPYLSSS